MGVPNVAPVVQVAKVAAGASVSEAIRARFNKTFGVIWPATMTNSASNTGFEVAAVETGPWTVLEDAAGAAIVAAVADATAVALPAGLAAWPFWRFKFAGNEAAERLVTVCCKD